MERNETSGLAARCGGVWRMILAALAIGSLAQTANAYDVRVKIENLAPSNGLFFTPVWVGFHNGGFDVYDSGSAASMGLERIAEDGDPSVLAGEFAASPAGIAGGIGGVITSPGGFAPLPVFDPGETVTTTFSLDPTQNRYFSYASMVIPSNDAFFANGDPLAHMLFDASGNFTGPTTILITGNRILDAGTEDNTEMDAAFINQTAGNTGVTTVGGVVGAHPGFIGSLGNPSGTSIILGGTTAAGTTIAPVLGDFTQQGFVLARITVVPEPSSIVLAGLGLAAFAALGARRRLRRVGR
ncbi:MAG: spondin domain-containing protein [Pirellulales bacterium]